VQLSHLQLVRHSYVILVNGSALGSLSMLFGQSGELGNAWREAAEPVINGDICPAASLPLQLADVMEMLE
jgi:hypothetical protein